MGCDDGCVIWSDGEFMFLRFETETSGKKRHIPLGGPLVPLEQIK
jgi:hypothetical protein